MQQEAKNQPTPIAEQIKDLLQRDLSGEIPFFDFVQEGLVLGAKRLDEERRLHGKPAVHLETLHKIQDQEGVEAFSIGFNGGIKIGKSSIDETKEFASFISNIDPILPNAYLIYETVGRLRTTTPQNKTRWTSFKNDLDAAQVSPELRSFSYLQLLASNTARKIRESVTHLLQQPIEVLEGKEQDFWHTRLIRGEYKPGIEFLKGYYRRIIPIIETKANDIFVDQNQVALKLLISLVNITLPSSVRPRRISILQALDHGQVLEAENQLIDIVCKKPDIASEKIKRYLGLTDEVIHAYLLNQNAIRYLSEEEKNAIRTQRLIDQIRSANENQRFLTNPEMVERAKQLIGHTLVHSTPIESKGKIFMYDRRLEYISGSDTRLYTIRDLNSKGEIIRTTRELPTILIRSFQIFPLRQAHFSITSHIFPGRVIQRLESGEDIDLGNVGDLSDVSVLSAETHPHLASYLSDIYLE